MSRSTRRTRTAAIRRGITDALADIAFTEAMGYAPIRWNPAGMGPKELALYMKASDRTVARAVLKAFQSTTKKAVYAADWLEQHEQQQARLRDAHMKEDPMADETDGYPDLEPGELEAMRAEDLRKIPKTKETTMTDIYDEVRAERARQIEAGYDAAHDDEHGVPHLGRIAKSYLAEAVYGARRAALVKAAAMIVAAIEAHDRWETRNANLRLKQRKEEGTLPPALEGIVRAMEER